MLTSTGDSHRWCRCGWLAEHTCQRRYHDRVRPFRLWLQSCRIDRRRPGALHRPRRRQRLDPTIANVDQLDIAEVVNGATADGVGDACDPRPTRPGDSIAFFAACDQADSELVRFNATSFSDDGMVVGSVDGAGSAQLRFRPNLTRADMRFTVLASAATGTQWVGLWYRTATSDRRASFASINRAIPAAAVADLDEAQLTGPNRLSDSIIAAPALLPGMEFQLSVDTARLSTNDDVLHLNAMNPPVNASIALSSTVADISGDPFFEANLVQVRLHYLILYASQN